MKKGLFIINPKSGTSGEKRLDHDFLSYLKSKKITFSQEFTQRPGHATELATQAAQENYDFVVAMGGDGTINETAKALIGTDTALGIIPAGSGNGLARHLQIPLNHKEAANILLKNNTIHIDVGYLNNNPFFCTSGLGFDALISHEFAKSKRRGFLSYAKITMKEFANYQPNYYKITVDGKSFETNAFMVTMANASQFGNDAYISPEAKITDGLIDVCVIHDFPKRYFSALLLRSLFKTIHRSKFMTVIRGKDIRIESEQKIFTHIDGEPIKNNSQFDYSIQKNKLKVLV